MVLRKLPVPVRPTFWMIVGQGPIALTVGAGGGGGQLFGHFYSPLFSPLSPSLWETARYRLKCCLKGPLNPKQPTNQLCLSSVILLFVKIYLSVFPFDIWDGLWVLIRPVPEVHLLL